MCGTVDSDSWDVFSTSWVPGEHVISTTLVGRSVGSFPIRPDAGGDSAKRNDSTMFHHEAILCIIALRRSNSCAHCGRVAHSFVSCLAFVQSH